MHCSKCKWVSIFKEVCKFWKSLVKKINKINYVLILCESTFGVNTLHNKTFFFIKYKFMKARWSILYCICIYIYISLWTLSIVIKCKLWKMYFYGVVKRYLCYAFFMYFYRGVKYNIRNAYKKYLPATTFWWGVR